MARLGHTRFDRSFAGLAEEARRAEAAGHAGFWVADTVESDAVAEATVALAATKELPVHVIVLPWRLPRQAANAVATLAAEYGPRVGLVLVTGHSAKRPPPGGSNNESQGVPFAPPVERLRDYHDCVTALLRAPRGEPVELVREHWRIAGEGRGLDARAAPVTFGGFAPKLVRAAGEVADGICLHHPLSEALVSSRLAGARAARAAGPRAGDPFLTVLALGISIDRDEETALRRARVDVTGAMREKRYRDRIAEEHPELAERIEELVAAGDLEAVARALPDDVVRANILVTTRERAAEEVAALDELDVVLARPPLGRFLVPGLLGVTADDALAARAEVLRLLKLA